jgi:hypothetical protein
MTFRPEFLAIASVAKPPAWGILAYFPRTLKPLSPEIKKPNRNLLAKLRLLK